MEEKMVFVWLGLMILFLIMEIATVGLTSIWFAGGALAALLVSFTGISVGWQIAVFLIAAFLLLFFTRPFARKYINSHHEKTNYEELPGKIVKITETVDNLNQTGAAMANGLEWTARSEKDNEKMEKGSLAKVVSVSGVKLILTHYEEE